MGKASRFALTALGRPEDRARALLAGFQIHVPKPVEATEFVAAIANVAGLVARPPAPQEVADGSLPHSSGP